MHSINIRKFNELSLDQLYHMLWLRQSVFIIEQSCLWPEIDGKDPMAEHLSILDENEVLMACCRMFGPDQYYPGHSAIGRVCTAAFARSLGVGKVLMKAAIEHLEAKYVGVPIKIGAQQYLQKFYENLGFEQSSEPYIEDDILHIEMIKK